MKRNAFVYIITNKPQGVLYIGVTSNLNSRMLAHKNRTYKGFSHKYSLDRLVFYEDYSSIDEAILREKK